MDENEKDFETPAEPLRSMLANAAEDLKPRLFAIYGTEKQEPDELVLGWGMEFANDDGAVFRKCGSRSIHTGDTAERLFRTQSIVGDVELKWLDR
ncbi:hypothetical protein CFN78_13210 [Amycolatopsis antarctica]|uniref:Uncharacterized protein n=1 Tax=Amycolatopsis antarctica TaxID=1854586 RepID=A0A263D4R2_9PSEU|nr:hypothetical protein [Amycolatopsis antarctica]OZM72597.1 hypothetical protein CFN78_13210 [Amycolatopsis antarctica]